MIIFRSRRPRSLLRGKEVPEGNKGFRPESIILGIDPGTARMGYSVLSHEKKKVKLLERSVIVTPAEMEMHLRLKSIFEELNSIVKKYSPEIMIIEKLFFNTNAKTAMTVGQARGVSMLIAANHKMKVFEYTALEAKKELTGYGRADKKDMQKSVMNYLKLKEIIKSDDANDAVAIVLCYFLKQKVLSGKTYDQNNIRKKA